jgi:hypothetical protein
VRGERRSGTARAGKRSIFMVAVALLSLFFLSCYHSAVEMRYWCLTRANRSVGNSEGNPEAHERLVREMYLLCLEAQGVSDATPSPSSD